LRRAAAIAAVLGVAVSGATTGTASAHHDDDVANASAEELANGDGIATLPTLEGPFPDTKNMRFLSQLGPEDLGALPLPGNAKGMLNDIWGWESPAGEEYALVGTTDSLAVVRITDPENPEFLGSLESQRPFDGGNLWGHPSVFGNFAYYTSEINGSQLEIVDLSGLDALGPAPSRDTVLQVPTFLTDAGGYRSAHNIQVNEETGFAYVAGVRLAPGAANNACGLENPPRFNTLIYDLNADPTNPQVAACVPDVGEHDFYPIVYNGPDERFQGREILFVFDGRDRVNPTGQKIGGFTEIWDVTDKGNIEVLAKFRVPDLVFSHNGWTTEAQDFLFIGDELDELIQAGWEFARFFGPVLEDTTHKVRTGTYIVDIRQLDNPVVVERFEHSTASLDHNFIVKDDKLYQANYTSGTRVLQINRDANGTVSLSEIAHMDTEPRLPSNILNIEQENKFGSAFLGQWGVYPLFDSGTIIASDRNNGLIVMELSDEPCEGIECSE
jgi:choice-of-anchor B domain-containing protein